MALEFLQPTETPSAVPMDKHDLGWRKYFLTFVTILALIMGAAATHYWGENKFLETYKTFGGYLIDVLGIYVVGNVSYKIGAGVVNSKVMAAASKPEGSAKAE